MRTLILQKFFLICGDLLSFIFSLYITEILLNILRPGNAYIKFSVFGPNKIFALFLIFVFWYQEQYTKRRPIWEDFYLLFKTIFVFAIIQLVFNYFISHFVFKLMYLLFWIILIVILPIFRIIIKLLMIKLNIWYRNVYIIGNLEIAKDTIGIINENIFLGYKILGYIPLDEIDKIQKHQLAIDILTLNNLFEDKNNKIIEVILTIATKDIVTYATLINKLQMKFNLVSIIPDIYGLPLYGAELNHFIGKEQLFLRLQNNLGRRLNRIVKRIFDIIISLILLVLLLPVFIIISVLIKFTSPKDPICYKHRRIGFNGKEFYCLKFRTMHVNSKDILLEILKNPNIKNEWEKNLKLKNDPRITKIGKILRIFSLDEFPQLLNVFSGEMSLVGPRPIIKDEIKKYGDNFYYYTLVKPGITGLWQISGRNDVDYTNRINFDVWYVKNWSLWYDLVILIKTIQVVFKRTGAY